GPAQVRNREAVADAADQVTARDLQALFVLEELQRLLNDLEGEAEKAGELQPYHSSSGVQRAQDEIVQEAKTEPGLFHGLGRRRRFGQVRAFPLQRGAFAASNHGGLLYLRRRSWGGFKSRPTIPDDEKTNQDSYGSELNHCLAATKGGLDGAIDFVP